MFQPGKGSVSGNRVSLMNGFFGVGVWHPKHEVNIGTLWRSAQTYQASLLATVGRRYQHQSSDTTVASRSVPLIHFGGLDDLIDHLPYSCPLVAVENSSDAEDLTTFVHPVRGFYLLGAEDHGLSESVLQRCHRHVRIPTPTPAPLNTSVAGTLVMADRYVKSRHRLSSVSIADLLDYLDHPPVTN